MASVVMVVGPVIRSDISMVTNTIEISSCKVSTPSSSTGVSTVTSMNVMSARISQRMVPSQIRSV